MKKHLIAGIELNTKLDLLKIVTFLIYQKPLESPLKQKLYADFKKNIQDDINRKVTEFPEIYHGLLLFAANHDLYSFQEKEIMLGRLIKDLDNFK